LACLALAAWPLPAALGQAIPDTIAVEDVPEVPKEIVRGLAKYQNIRVAAFQDWVGAKREVLILTRFADVPQVHHAGTALGARPPPPYIPERIGGARMRPNHDELAFTGDEGGAENFQVSLFEIKTADVNRITDGRSRNISPVWSNSGKWIAWSSNAR